MYIVERIKEKRDNYNSVQNLFKNENGAIDLASIMVGIIVIGLIGGVIAATVFAVIPWSQDNAAKHQIDSVVAAQSAYMGLSSGVPPAIPSTHTANSYANSLRLEEAGLMKQGVKYCTVSTDAGKGFAVFSKSDTGKIWTATHNNTKPQAYAGTLPAECNFLAAPVAPVVDTDGDGIPDAADWDSNGDGRDDDETIPAGYTPGGKTTGSDGTPYSIVGVYEASYVKSGGTVITMRFWLDYAHSNKTVSFDVGATCVRADGSTYEDRRIDLFVANGRAATLLTDIARCGTDRISAYVIKPLTTQTIQSGAVANPSDASGYTINDGFRWSEPDGYLNRSGNYESSYVTDGGRNVTAVFYTGQSPMGTRLVSQFKGICERINQPAYKVNKLIYVERPASGMQSILNIPVCADGRIDSYTIKPVTSLSAVENRMDFTTGLTMDRSSSWEESANGYSILGNLESITRVDNDTNLVVRAYVPYGNMGRLINTQYELTCAASDGSTRKINRIASYTATSNTGGAIAFTVPACGADQLTAYTFQKVSSLGVVENPEDFKTVTFDRTYSWVR